jgi:hypothetical protein
LLPLGNASQGWLFFLFSFKKIKERKKAHTIRYEKSSRGWILNM